VLDSIVMSFLSSVSCAPHARLASYEYRPAGFPMPSARIGVFDGLAAFHVQVCQCDWLGALFSGLVDVLRMLVLKWRPQCGGGPSVSLMSYSSARSQEVRTVPVRECTCGSVAGAAATRPVDAGGSGGGECG